MNIYGRPLGHYVRAVKSIPEYASAIGRLRRTFKSPQTIVRGYVSQRCPPGTVLHTHTGMAIALSAQPFDLVSTFLIFGRRDYGDVRPKDVVVDIGANVGLFSYLAAMHSAAVVHAYEPNMQACALIRANMAANAGLGCIQVHPKAAWSVTGETIHIPSSTSIFNRASVTSPAGGPTDQVTTINLKDIVANVGGRIDVLKVDCEGAEYPVLLNATAETLRCIKSIRMEYHDGRYAELAKHLLANGFRETTFRPDNPNDGCARFDRLA